MSVPLPTQPGAHESSQGAPLPPATPDTAVNFQPWHEFKPSTQQWSQVDPTYTSRAPDATQQSDPNNLVLVTWNIDAFSTFAKDRISGIISHVLSFTPAPDIIFLQEVPREGLNCVLRDSRIRESYFSSEADWTNWGGLTSFATMTLLSRSRFGYGENPAGTATLGPVWRVKYPSRFRRDALCCDVFVPSTMSTTAAVEAGTTTPLPSVSDSPSSTTTSRVRLVNVHLDSLAMQPSYRPRQISITASLLRAAGRGLVAGDFNPVLPEDDALVGANGLEDAWTALRPGEPGPTWGIDGKQPFPPGRLDKIAMVGLRAREVEVMNPGPVNRAGEGAGVGSGKWRDSEAEDSSALRWSDHSGLRCSFGLLQDGNPQTI